MDLRNGFVEVSIQGGREVKEVGMILVRVYYIYIYKNCLKNRKRQSVYKVFFYYGMVKMFVIILK